MPRQVSTLAASPLAGHSTASPRLAGQTRSRAAWLFPGLGSRHVGMGADIIGQHPAADRVIDEASRWLGYDVARVCLEGSGRKWVPERQEVQVVYVISCAYVELLRDMGMKPGLVCGHSMGSWAAAYTAGVFDLTTGLELMSRFDDLMGKLIDPMGHGMGVIVGLRRRQVAELCRQRPGVYLANLNSKGQFVVAGDELGVEQVLEAAMDAGANKIKRLPTTRAMHTPLMSEFLRCTPSVLATVPLGNPRVPMVSENDGSWLTTARDVRRYLAVFLGMPVLWESTIRGLVEGGMREFVEAGAGAILTRMMWHIDNTVAVQAAPDVVCAELAR